jgi:very-short-patch-repair endonuclease
MTEREAALSALRALARAQYHVVSRRQAREAGLDRWQIEAAVASGEWTWSTTRVLRLTGGRASYEQQCMTVVLHTGGVLGGESTMALCRIPGFPRRGPIHVVIRRGQRIHYSDAAVISQVRSLPDHHVMTIAGIPSVTPTRAIYDLAAEHHWAKVQRALKNTWRRKLTSGGLIHRMGPEWLKRGRPGTVAMRALLAVTPADYEMPDSNLEERFFSILEVAGFPPLKRQVNMGDDSRWIGRVDGRDPELPLIAEVDSETFHFAPIDGDDDAARDAAFGESGLTIVRFTENEIWHEPAVVVARWRQARAELSARS